MNVPRLRFKDFIGEWEVKKLDSIADLTSSKRVYLSDYVNEGIPFYRGKEISELKRNVKPKDILYITREAYEAFKSSFGVPQVNDILITAVGTLGNVYRIKNDSEFYFKDGNLIWLKGIKILPSFLEILLETNQEIIQKSSIGSSQRALTIVELKKLKFKIPSLPEQTKIANFLTAIDEKISQLTQKYDLLKQYKKGIMQQIFSQKLRFKDEDGREFPEWEVKKLGELAKFRRGSFPQPYGLAKWYDEINGMPFIQVFDVDDNFRLKATTKNKISKEAQLESVYVESGSILITIQGSIGRIAVTQYDAYVDRTLLLFESFRIKINKYYFAYVLFLLFEIEKEKAPGGIIKTITKEVLTDFKVFICDYAEQTKIANFLTAIDDKITQAQTQLDAVKQYKKGLLQQLFV